jgi:hypothetical protein
VRLFIYAAMATICVCVLYVAGFDGTTWLRRPPKPVPQDPDRQEQRLRDTLAWNRRTLAGAYEAVGKKDPRWDADARAALEAAARYFSRTPEPLVEPLDIHRATQRALRAGCDDALILCLHARSFYGANMPAPAEMERHAATAAAAMTGSAYPAFRRGAALHMAGYQKLKQPNATPARRAEAAKLLDAALHLLPVSAAEDERSPTLENMWFERASTLVTEYRQLGSGPEQALAKVEAALAGTAALETTRLLVRADFLFHYAWEQVRGNAWGNCNAPAASVMGGPTYSATHPGFPRGFRSVGMRFLLAAVELVGQPLVPLVLGVFHLAWRRLEERTEVVAAAQAHQRVSSGVANRGVFVGQQLDQLLF